MNRAWHINRRLGNSVTEVGDDEDSDEWTDDLPDLEDPTSYEVWEGDDAVPDLDQLMATCNLDSATAAQLLAQHPVLENAIQVVLRFILSPNPSF